MAEVAAEGNPVLDVSGVSAGYGRVRVLEDVSLQVAEGSLVTVVGSNGAGKSTLLRTISGLIHPATGSVRFTGADISRSRPDEIVRLGLVHVAEGRRLFRAMSVRDNLRLGLYRSGLNRDEEDQRQTEVLELFPVLADRLDARAGILSGGQQQMLAIAQTLVRRPRLLMLDEPSLGLAPVIIDQVFEVLRKLRAEGTTVLLVEQVVERALEVADYAYVLQSGRLFGEGSPRDLSSTDLVARAYLGAAANK